MNLDFFQHFKQLKYYHYGHCWLLSWRRLLCHMMIWPAMCEKNIIWHNHMKKLDICSERKCTFSSFEWHERDEDYEFAVVTCLLQTYLLVIFLQEPFNGPVGTYNNFQHPMGAGQPPQLPTSPPTYESVSERAPPIHAPFLFPQMDRRTGQGTTQGRAVCLQFCLSSTLLNYFSDKARTLLYSHRYR